MASVLFLDMNILFIVYMIVCTIKCATYKNEIIYGMMVVRFVAALSHVYVNVKASIMIILW